MYFGASAFQEPPAAFSFSESLLDVGATSSQRSSKLGSLSFLGGGSLGFNSNRVGDECEMFPVTNNVTVILKKIMMLSNEFVNSIPLY